MLKRERERDSLALFLGVSMCVAYGCVCVCVCVCVCARLSREAHGQWFTEVETFCFKSALRRARPQASKLCSSKW